MHTWHTVFVCVYCIHRNAYRGTSAATYTIHTTYYATTKTAHVRALRGLVDEPHHAVCQSLATRIDEQSIVVSFKQTNRRDVPTYTKNRVLSELSAYFTSYARTVNLVWRTQVKYNSIHQTKITKCCSIDKNQRQQLNKLLVSRHSVCVCACSDWSVCELDSWSSVEGVSVFVCADVCAVVRGGHPAALGLSHFNRHTQTQTEAQTLQTATIAFVRTCLIIVCPSVFKNVPSTYAYGFAIARKHTNCRHS